MILKAHHSVLALLLISGAASGDPWTESARGSDFNTPVAGAVGGAVVGGLLGGIIAGGSGAAVGAVIVGTAGAVAGVEQRRITREQVQQANYGERAEWERERRRRQQQLAQQREVAWVEGVGDTPSVAAAEVIEPLRAVARSSPAPAPVDQTLLIETQRSLIRLGFDPGDIGSLNRQTVATIKLYQTQHDLVETGQPSQALLKHMIRSGG